MFDIENIDENKIITVFEFESLGKEYNKANQILSFTKVFQNQNKYNKMVQLPDSFMFLKARVEEDVFENAIDFFKNLGLNVFKTFKEYLSFINYKQDNYKEVIDKMENDLCFYINLDETIYSFMKKYKKEIIKFAKACDTTIMLYPLNTRIINFYSFFCFNFLDSDEKGDVTVDFSTNSIIYFEKKNSEEFIKTCNLLSKFANSEKELSELNINIVK